MKATEIQRVKQEEPFGCMIACLAMILHSDYRVIRSDFSNPALGIEIGLRTHEMQTYLNEKGIRNRAAIYDPRLAKNVTDYFDEPADFYILEVLNSNNSYHAVLMLPDGQIIDPLNDTVLSQHDYNISRITAVWNQKQDEPIIS